MAKRLVVIVPGSKTKMSRSKVIKSVLEKFYRHFGVDTENDNDWTAELREVLSKDKPETEVVVFEWSGGITRYSIRKAGRELHDLISDKECPEVILFCKSLGGAVGEAAARQYGRKIKLIQVATPHGPFERRIPEADIINVYSLQDKYLKFGNNILFGGFGKTVLKHARNISLPDIGHSMFNKNIGIEYKNKKMRLFDFYKEFIFGTI